MHVVCRKKGWQSHRMAANNQPSKQSAFGATGRASHVRGKYARACQGVANNSARAMRMHWNAGSTRRFR